MVRRKKRRLVVRTVCLLGGWYLLSQVGLAQEPDTSIAGNEKVAEIIRNFGGRGVMADDSDPTPASEAVAQFQLHEGLAIDLVACEPEVSQPLFLTWDSRGRMWVVQYRQYQFPAGLKIVRYDQHLRAVFDKVPEPPPHGVRGADKITVFEDTDGDGLYDKHKDVVTGLNIATSVQIGHGGIWVLNPPYLLFYPDANGDDVPDGDPEVHLSGFGLQDTHSVANSLLWGPDGWLYGANGSTTIGTVSSRVTKGVYFEGQCIWRYHPDTHVFEIYAEGGGNTFSLDIDSKGRIFSGTNFGNTRGMYYPQGSYAEKNWGKHGPLTNPYAFGFFLHMKNNGDERRFSQAFAIYEGGLLPRQFHETIVGPNALQNLVWQSDRIPDGSTYRTKDTAHYLTSPDRWFRPVYTGVGPDGAIYLADWYDTRLSHVSPVDDWHKESGRIYRIRKESSPPRYRGGDLSKLSHSELIAHFDHPNKWVRKRALLELGWRGDKSVTNDLARKVSEDGSLEALWAINLLDELTPDRVTNWLRHKDSHIRRWVVRLVGDRGPRYIVSELDGHDATNAVRAALATLALNEEDVHVRSQLASTAKRIDTISALGVIENLLRHDQDVDDPHMPLLIWWALEAHAKNWPAIEALFSAEDLWSLPMTRQAIVSRLMQRYAAAETTEDLHRAARLVELAPNAESVELLLTGLNRAYQGRSLPKLPDTLNNALTAYQEKRGEAGVVLALRQGSPNAVPKALDSIRNRSADLGIRIELARTFGEIRHDAAIDSLIRLATARDTREPSLQRVALQSLGRYDDARIPRAIIGSLGGAISAENDLRSTACRTLAGRAAWAKALLKELTDWRLRESDIPPDVVQRLRTYQDPEIATAVQKVFGKQTEISSPAKIEKIKRLTQLLTVGTGTSNVESGKLLFTKRCATCHKLFGEGKQIGPPLDAYDRASLKFWLPAIVEPSLEIREGYQSYMAVTKDALVINGMIDAQDANTVTLRTAEDQRVVLARNNLQNLKAIETSLMPDDTLKDLTDQQLRDLFAYLSLGARKRP